MRGRSTKSEDLKKTCSLLIFHQPQKVATGREAIKREKGQLELTEELSKIKGITW